MELMQLIYASELAEGVTAKTIANIVEAAAIKNQRLGLTGYLAFNTRYCLQLLEGGRGNLNELYAQIVGDDRHRHAMLLGCGAVSRRSFPDWGMNFATLTDAKKQVYFQFCPSEEFLPHQLGYESARDLLIHLSHLSK